MQLIRRGPYEARQPGVLSCLTLLSNPMSTVAWQAVDDFLSLRTLLVGYAVSLADLAAWGALSGGWGLGGG